MKFYKNGKDSEPLLCIELDDGTIITEPEILLALIKALIKKGVIKQSDIKAALSLAATAAPEEGILSKIARKLGF